MPKLLLDLGPQWIGVTRTPEHGEGVALACPVCGPDHTLAVYFSNPLDGGAAAPASHQWTRSGTTFDELTVEPSIQYPCFHGWIENGLVFDYSESPMTLPVKVEDGIGLIALSPKQTRDICTKMLATVEALTRR
ncbi:MAG TPA: hypothetical protein VGP89_03485 [Candidatus Angelobacter sp.]|jgi:hypothetical protein|nr:hypothetical protein [Candidatus Angelobacter sp.]